MFTSITFNILLPRENFFSNSYGPQAISTVDESNVRKYFLFCSLFFPLSENLREVTEQTGSMGTFRRPSYRLL
jgi:hypothetical protein